MRGPIADHFVAHAWRSFRYGDGPGYLMDAAAGYLARAPETVLNAATPSPEEATLAQATATWATNPTTSHPPTDKHELRLALLGGRILARFVHRTCRDEVARYFSSSLDETGASPDVIVECGWPTANRYLYRARPSDQEGQPLDGVLIRAFGEHAARPWTSAQPPFPPLAVAPFRDRFIALHAATLRSPAGHGVLIAGERGSGKSTAAVHLGQQPGFAFLADETTFIHLRTRLAEPFPHSVGVRDGALAKEVAPAAELFPNVTDQPVLVGQLIILSPGSTDHVVPLDPADTLCALLPHLRDASAPTDDAIATLDHLARNVPSIRLTSRDSSELLHLLDNTVRASPSRA